MYGNRKFIEAVSDPSIKRKPQKSKTLSFKLFFSLTAFLLIFFLIKSFPFRKNITIPEKPIHIETAEEKYYRTLLNTPESTESHLTNLGAEFNTSNQPVIAGKSAILIDRSDGEKVVNFDSETRRPIASLVKIMTAVVAVEHKKIDEKITVSQNAASTGENVMGISEGEVYTLEELLYGLFLNSGNDSAVAISEGVAGDERTFITWMNIKANELGLKNTYFADPSGLNDTSYSTASDLAILASFAINNPDIKRIGSTVIKELPYSGDHKYLYLENQTNLLTTYPGVKGLKTGYTEEAGLCLVTYAENEGKELIGVVLNSIDRKGDMILMLDHGFSTFGINVVHHLLD